MGYGAWDDFMYKTKVSSYTRSGKSSFSYNDDVLSKIPHSERKVHDSLNPHNKVRESRDSDEHPNSNAISVLFDVTGSMGSIPRILQKNLPKLMGMLLRRGFISDPQVMFGAIGDATCDRAPLQIGQFESDLKMDDCLEHIYIESGGGGQTTESYELAMYFMANKISMDCYEKRNKRGYLFIIADEQPYSAVNSSQVAKIIGDTPQENITLEEIAEQLLEKWEVFVLMPTTGGAFHRYPKIKEQWVELFGQNVIEFDPAEVSEVIASTIGLAEGYSIDDVHAALDDIGSSDKKKSVSTAVANVTSTSSLSVGSKRRGKLVSNS